MEEILASIRRIISEDDAPPEEGAGAVAASGAEPAPHPFGSDDEEDEGDVLELTERVEFAAVEPEPQTAFEPEPKAAAIPASPFVRAETSGVHDVPPTSKPEAPRMQDDGERLVSEPSAAAAANAFGRLSAHVAMPEPGRTLEDVTKELLRPVLRAWLDENLPRIVEAKVAEEVERLSRGRVR